MGLDELREELLRVVREKYSEKVERLGDELMRVFERDVMLRVADQSWKDHLLALDHLKEGIGLRGYGQRDPKNEYKRESYELFQDMKERVEGQRDQRQMIRAQAANDLEGREDVERRPRARVPAEEEHRRYRSEDKIGKVGRGARPEVEQRSVFQQAPSLEKRRSEQG